MTTTATLEIAVDSGEFYRSSEIALDGAQAAQSFTVEYRSMPAGDYEVPVRLRAQKGDGACPRPPRLSGRAHDSLGATDHWD